MVFSYKMSKEKYMSHEYFTGQGWNPVILEGLTEAQAYDIIFFVNQEWELGDQKWSDTAVVLSL